jgi:hypothetical protein
MCEKKKCKFFSTRFSTKLKRMWLTFISSKMTGNRLVKTKVCCGKNPRKQKGWWTAAGTRKIRFLSTVKSLPFVLMWTPLYLRPLGLFWSYCANFFCAVHRPLITGLAFWVTGPLKGNPPFQKNLVT